MFTNASVSGSQEEEEQVSVGRKRKRRRRKGGILDLKPCGNATYFLPSDGDNSGGGPASFAGILKDFFHLQRMSKA